MKILHINTFDYGGAAIGAIRIHKSLLDSGIDSNILFYKKNSEQIPKASGITVTYPSLKQRLLKRFGIKLTSFEKEIQKINQLGKPFSEGGSFELFSSPYGIENQLHQHPLVISADVINLHWISGFVDLPSFMHNINKPLVWTLHDMNPFMGGVHYDIDIIKNPQLIDLENQYKSLKKQLFMDKNYAIVGNSEWTTQKATDSKQFETAKIIETGYYPFNPADFNIIDKSIAKNSLKLPLDKLIIGFACEDLRNPRKGFDKLLKAISHLSKEETEKICCLSFGKENREINQIQGLEVIQLGTINNPKIQSLAYSAMDFFIIPSTAEAFGQTCLEAMYCKTPILGANVGGIPEMVKELVTGFLFESDSEIAILEAIQKAIKATSKEKELLARNAHEYAIKIHNPECIANQYLKIYKSLLT